MLVVLGVRKPTITTVLAQRPALLGSQSLPIREKASVFRRVWSHWDIDKYRSYHRLYPLPRNQTHNIGFPDNCFPSPRARLPCRAPDWPRMNVSLGSAHTHEPSTPQT
jgi:hypothetical protein